MTIPQEAIEAAAKAIQEHWVIYGRLFKCCSCGYVAPEKDQAATQASVEKHIVEISLTAAYPSIEKQIRAEVAAEIRVEMRRHDTAQIGFSAIGDAYAHAARIARGQEQD